MKNIYPFKNPLNGHPRATFNIQLGVQLRHERCVKLRDQLWDQLGNQLSGQLLNLRQYPLDIQLEVQLRDKLEVQLRKTKKDKR